ncbi:trimeric LpxA-like protein [Polyplosphaeria fusca]|uniref:Dynactin subunit 6 n=1 Tax=Polyplosphaeria fusca TaxID=682080 RepID=A0A9P4R0F4_9PLEO|nr:trimeric LpxA-like protein [Polyplosphaeria fusca]
MSSQPAARPSADRRTSAIQKRVSILPKPSSMVIDPSVLIAQHAQLTGTHPITIGPNAVLHPHCKISSVQAPVVLGEGVVIYEKAKVGVGIGNADTESRRSSVVPSPGSRDSLRVDGTVLGRNVVIETSTVVEAAEIGEGSVVEVNAVIGQGCVIGRFCTISASSVLPPNTHLPDFTVVYGASERRIDYTTQARPELQEAKMMMHTKQIEIFKKLVPNNVTKWTS